MYSTRQLDVCIRQNLLTSQSQRHSGDIQRASDRAAARSSCGCGDVEASLLGRRMQNWRRSYGTSRLIGGRHFNWKSGAAKLDKKLNDEAGCTYALVP